MLLNHRIFFIKTENSNNTRANTDNKVHKLVTVFANRTCLRDNILVPV
jgi:hypothetical protein